MRGYMLGVLVVVWGVVGSGRAGEVVLDTEQKVLDAGGGSGGTGPYVFNGAYEIQTVLDLSTTGRPDIVIDGGTMKIVEETEAGDYLLKVRDFTMNAGELTISGSDGKRAIHVTGDFHQNGGTINATGRLANGNAIMYVGTTNSTNTYYMNGGTLNATGCSQYYANGVAMEYAVLKDGVMNLTGGGKNCEYSMDDTTAEYANGMSVSKDFTMDGGVLKAEGGNGTQAAGLRASGTFFLNKGTATALGSAIAPKFGFGIQTSKYEQTGGVMNAVGAAKNGTSFKNVGLVVFDAFAQTGGELNATGGEGVDAYGVWLYKDGAVRDIAGTVRMERLGEAASVFSDSEVTFQNGAVVKPVVNLAQADDALAAGLLQTANKKVFIQNGVCVSPILRGAASLGNGEERTLVFIDTGTGGIDGVFSCFGDTVTLAYEVAKDASENRYLITVRRNASVGDFLPNLSLRNSTVFIESMQPHVSPGPSPSDALEAVWSDLEGCGSVEELHRRAAYIGQRITPHAYTKVTHSLVRMGDLVDLDFTRQLDSHIAGRAGMAATAGGTRAYARLVDAARGRYRADGALRLWANPLYQRSSRHRARTAEFEDGRETFYGLSAGVSRDCGALALAGSLHYVRGAYDTPATDIDTDTYGILLGARLHDFLPSGGWLNPWVQATAGYDHSRIDQRNLDYAGMWRESDPAANVFRIGLLAGTDIDCGRFRVSPRLGADFAHIRQNGYTEREGSAYRLSVAKGLHRSLRPRAGVEVEAAVGADTTVSARAYYRYETLDKNSGFDASFADFPALRFDTMGERRSRSSGMVGVGAARRVGRATVSASYDLLIEPGYRAHRFGAGIGLAF